MRIIFILDDSGFESKLESILFFVSRLVFIYCGFNRVRFVGVILWRSFFDFIILGFVFLDFNINKRVV